MPEPKSGTRPGGRPKPAPRKRARRTLDVPVTTEEVRFVARTGQPYAVTPEWSLTVGWLIEQLPTAAWLPGFLALRDEWLPRVAERLNSERPWRTAARVR